MGRFERQDSAKRRRARLFVALAVAALLVPAVADARPGKGSGKGAGQRERVSYVFRGTYEGDGSVHVRTGNVRVRKGGFIGRDVDFDFSRANFSVSDLNEDGEANLLDVETGDSVVVRARLSRRPQGRRQIRARRLVDRTNPRQKEQVLDEEESPEEEQDALEDEEAAPEGETGIEPPEGEEETEDPQDPEEPLDP